jgi:type IX secretion system PorP/SprF family membrane protein
MKMKKIYFLLLLFVGSFASNAQQDPQSSFYFNNPLSYNPAYAGTRGTLNMNMVHRSQWIGWDGAPSTQYISVHAPVARQRIGLGTNLTFDKTGARNSIDWMNHASFQMQLNPNNLRLSLGVSGGIQKFQYDFNGLSVTNPNDPNFTTPYNKSQANFGAGAYLYKVASDNHVRQASYFVGLSVPHLIERNIDNNNGNATSQRHYFLTGGYVFPINSVTDLRTSTLMKFTKNSPAVMELNVSALFYKQFWIGSMYRLGEGLGFNTSYQINDNLMIGYAFDLPMNSMKLNQWGNHEVVISFDIRPRNNAFVSPRYF